MSPACPITHETLDDRAVRLCALLVLAPLGLALAFRSPWPALFLAVDFGLRGFGLRRWSPLAFLARRSAAALGLSRHPTNAAPKAFAAKLGFAFSLALMSALLVDNQPAALVTGLPFAMCAVLEGGLGFCVGCRIYQLGQWLGWRARVQSHVVPR
jgi:hypothetical protein